jgi:hypothetical protein
MARSTRLGGGLEGFRRLGGENIGDGVDHIHGSHRNENTPRKVDFLALSI